mmetsp:Transcript_6301/g.18120  ORF Transcript_6301/g.18120 Transcript_6301/m.18120 type:complete len:425 (-) Transcript_6301:180-1454(-)
MHAVLSCAAACGRQLRVTPVVARAANAAAAPSARRWSSGAAEAARRRLWRWGKGARAESHEPALEELRGVSAVACGSGHSAFVVDGRLYTCGSNKYSQLGRSVEGPKGDLGVVAFDSAVSQVSLGDQHTAALTEDGTLWTWGWGGSFWSGAGALGHGGKETVEAPRRVEQFVDAGEAVVQVACGGQHTLVLTDEGRVYSTGKGEFGRLGHGGSHDETEFREIEYFYDADDSVLAKGEAVKIVKVGAGSNYSAALSSSGELWLWGSNDNGQLGLGEEAMGDMYSAELYPRLVRSLPSDGLRVVDFACGTYQILVLTDQGSLYEWGGKTWLEPREVPVEPHDREKLSSVKKLATGDKFSLAVTADGTLFSWGSRATSCLAQGAKCTKIVPEPTPVPAGTFGHQPLVDVVASSSRCFAISLEDSYLA